MAGADPEEFRETLERMKIHDSESQGCECEKCEWEDVQRVSLEPIETNDDLVNLPEMTLMVSFIENFRVNLAIHVPQMGNIVVTKRVGSDHVFWSSTFHDRTMLRYFVEETTHTFHDHLGCKLCKIVFETSHPTGKVFFDFEKVGQVERKEFFRLQNPLNAAMSLRVHYHFVGRLCAVKTIKPLMFKQPLIKDLVLRDRFAVPETTNVTYELDL